MGTTTFGREGENLAKVYLEKKGINFSTAILSGYMAK